MTEAGDDSSNDLAIAVLADQNMRPGPAIPRRNHELLSMPEGEDNVAPRSDIDGRSLRGRASSGVSSRRCPQSSAAPMGGNNENFAQRSRRLFSRTGVCALIMITLDTVSISTLSDNG